MSACIFCYEMPPRCTAGPNGLTACSSKLQDSYQSLRGPKGVWPQAGRNALPNEFQSVVDGHFDSVTGCTAPSSEVVTEMTPENVAVRLKLVENTMVRTELGEVAN